MAKFRLYTPHYLNNKYYEAGSVVDYEDFKVDNMNSKGPRQIQLEVSMNVEPLDDEAQALYDKRMSRIGGQPEVSLMMHPAPDPKMPVPGQGPKAKSGPETYKEVPGSGKRDIAGNVPGVVEAKEPK